ncbi:MAG: tRNA lysidine(34) synthetase TilS [Brevibacterium sp.]|uniref:tRNA lysidine(34) synthetase TilS n=1 Tax=Brevibacterium sp. TaxID=1701 RepID=UPI002649A35B|nr:tRNA lysidine(34) synthetase TilS [Brevibacterium sp.]MDN5806615.1 tRNA lysidine(34) synthetase TilS [Brevibacterium sp.]MDN5833707.1 tRNA lysidine(34) synthetase TilS [Brevibacterium sp.]MDN5875974.1 tRNA lysidine(34) synthetase TilS [Brevibacterium sp.]MDN5910104.1 tRNA lysidine(34) synthetase TilS [Brevibacterium sp.]MDN6133500.1 tRNA lysidine(34) synthetase TilS [Brevibacterium sp.]
MSTAEDGSPRRPSLDPASAAIRNAVREAVAQVGISRPGVIVAVSGGADSMALLHACAFLHRRGELRAHAVTVDHGLQTSAAEVARRVVVTAESWGVPAEVATVTVDAGAEGLEAAARDARYGALEAARTEHAADWVLTAHTRSDQAETVLLGLMRGSGTRSLAGMALRTGEVVRPLLGLERATNEASCRAQSIEVWHDPMNADDSFARVRARSLLASLETDLGQPVTANLARTAELCRADADCLDELAETSAAAVRGRDEVPLSEIAGLGDAIASRVLREWLISLRVPAQSFGAARISELLTRIREALIREPEPPGRVHTRLSLPGDTEVIITEQFLRFRRDAKTG